MTNKLPSRILLCGFVLALAVRPLVVSFHNSGLNCLPKAVAGPADGGDSGASLNGHRHPLKKIAKQTSRAKSMLAPRFNLRISSVTESVSAGPFSFTYFEQTRLFSLRI